MTTEQLMDHFNKSRQTIYNWVRRGCPAVKVRIKNQNAQRYEFDLPSVEAWLLQQIKDS